MDSNRIRLVLIMAGALFCATYLGIAAATAQKEVVSWVLGGIFVTTCFLLGKNVWILIPASLAMKGNINFLPGTPAPWHLMTLVAATFLLLRVAIRRQSLSIKWTWMETSILLVAISILQALVRNPVGVSLFKSSEVAGGKPYFIFAFAFIAYYIIAIANTNIKVWCWAVILYLTFSVGDGAINALSGIFPGFGAQVIPFYSNVGYDSATTGYKIDLSQSRFTEVAQLGSILGLMACTLWRPLSALNLTKPWRFLVTAGAVVATSLGGFRGSLGSLFVNFVLASSIRKKWLDIFLAGFIALLILSALIATGSIRELPYGAQRMLSFLPLDIASNIKADADGSSDERFEMWRTALESDRYIKNKLLGDGFNMNARELQAMRNQTENGPQIYRTWTEAALETGAYHGFHVEAIRNTGVVGLLFATMALLVFMRYSWRVIQAHRNQHYWGLVLFICMPYLIHPFWYWLVFGSYKAVFPQVIAMAGMIKLIYAMINQEKIHSSGLKKLSIRNKNEKSMESYPF
jgi:hypothetical protein